MPALVILRVTSQFMDEWLLENLGPIIRAQGIAVEYNNGKTLFFAYLVSRARVIVEEHDAMEDLASVIYNFQLDD